MDRRNGHYFWAAPRTMVAGISIAGGALVKLYLTKRLLPRRSGFCGFPITDTTQSTGLTTLSTI